MPVITPSALLSVAMFALSAVLLTYASWRTPTTQRRLAALLALPVVLLANYFMLNAYTGEPPLEFGQHRRALERTVVEDRGRFDTTERRQRTGRGDRAGGVQDSGADMPGGDGSTGLGARLAGFISSPARPARPDDVIADCADCPEMVILRPGYFSMGATRGDEQALPAEKPSMVVRVGRPFAIARTEITVGQYAAFLRATAAASLSCASPMRAADQDMAVTCITWHEARAYAGWLSQQTSRTYRLPTEAEWESAARAGTSTPYAVGRALGAGDANIGNAGSARAGVAQFPPNGFGLHDMHGNVAELVRDCWVDTYRGRPRDSRMARQIRGCTIRVLRDAGAAEPVERSRVSARRAIGANERRDNVGFRVVRDM